MMIVKTMVERFHHVMVEALDIIGKDKIITRVKKMTGS